MQGIGFVDSTKSHGLSIQILKRKRQTGAVIRAALTTRTVHPGFDSPARSMKSTHNTPKADTSAILERMKGQMMTVRVLKSMAGMNQTPRLIWQHLTDLERDLDELRRIEFDRSMNPQPTKG